MSLFYGQSENTFRWPTFFITPNTCKYEKYFLEINFCQTKHFHNEIRGWEWKKWLIYIVSIYGVCSWWLLLIIVLRYQSVFLCIQKIKPQISYSTTRDFSSWINSNSQLTQIRGEWKMKTHLTFFIFRCMWGFRKTLFTNKNLFFAEINAL